MWLFTKYGFYSVVRQPSDQTFPDEGHRYILRARLREHLESLIANFSCFRPEDIVRTDEADYRYRVFLSSSEWLRLSEHLTETIDYNNFKAAVKAREGASDYEYVLHAVWKQMATLQYSEPQPIKPKKATRKQASRKAARRG